MRHLEEGGKRLNQSIILATSEVQRAMIYSTGIIIVAYSPLFFMGGVEGIIFKPMAFTMGFALIAAMILSLTFLPAMISLVKSGNGQVVTTLRILAIDPGVVSQVNTMASSWSIKWYSEGALFIRLRGIPG
jgi:Cu/Ag efflux pump CusA